MSEPQESEHCQSPTMPGQFEHVWKHVVDWMGDPNAYRGTVTWEYWECEICGLQRQSKP